MPTGQTTKKTAEPAAHKHADLDKKCSELEKRCAALESKLAALEAKCNAPAPAAELPDDVLTRADWERLKAALRASRHPARAADLL